MKPMKYQGTLERTRLNRASRGLDVTLLSALLWCTTPLIADANSEAPLNQNSTSLTAPTLVRAEDSNTVMDVSIWLNPRDKDQLDALARDLYDPTSPNYRHWLKSADIAARFAPSAAEVETVREYFAAQNLKVVKVGANNLFVRATGTAADVERAFHVKLNYYQMGSQTVRASDMEPTVVGPAAQQVYAISGLSDMQFEHPLTVAMTAASLSTTPTTLTESGDRASVVAHAATASAAEFFETACFPGSGTESVTTLGGYPKATYQGNSYRSGLTGCGYSPANLYKAFGLDDLYARGYNGAGQTIVLLDYCGSPTIQQDANAFSQHFGLPLLTADNFQIVEPLGPSQCVAENLGFNLEVEWTHAIAPGAKIILLVAPSNDPQDVDETWFYAINYGLGNVISGNFGFAESAYIFFHAAGELPKENLIAELGAVQGIASNFMSGDSGSNCFSFPAGCSAILPASATYATAVGGVSVALNPDNTIAFQTGWSNSEFVLDMQGDVLDPSIAVHDGYLFASGGGPSVYFAKPAFQKGVPGRFRQTPDISWLADPFTGVPILVSEAAELPEQVWTVVGGTQVATSMFSALWAIANQEAGIPLGQAAPYLYSMPAAAITDIIPYSSPSNPVATVSESSTSVQHFDSKQITFGVQGAGNERFFGPFYSAIWDYPLYADTVFVITFGSDPRLRTGIGWDDMTGLGSPNPKAFAEFFAAPAGAQARGD
jgi:subtilase family serine protease